MTNTDRAYYVERVSRTVTTFLVYAPSGKEAKRRCNEEGEALDSISTPRGFGTVERARHKDRSQ